MIIDITVLDEDLRNEWDSLYERKMILLFKNLKAILGIKKMNFLSDGKQLRTIKPLPKMAL